MVIPQIKKQVILVLFLLIQSVVFGQKKPNFIEITNIQFDEKPNRNISLADTLTLDYWPTLDDKRKKRLKKSITTKQNEIVQDSAKTAKIIFYGRPEEISLSIADSILANTFLKERSQKYIYEINDADTGASNYVLATLERNQGVKELTLLLLDSKRRATFKIDTSFSEIYINATTVLEKSLLQQQKEIASAPADTLLLNIAPETIAVLEENLDQLSIQHRIPRNE